MNAKIIPFPEQVETPLEEIDRQIRTCLAEIKADRDFIDYVATRMKYFIENYASTYFQMNFNLIVPPNLSPEQAEALVFSIEKGVQDNAKELQDMIRKIIMERLHLEIELYMNQKDIKYRLC
ncbi:hypothetical protein [Pelosinus sp. UFO1]|uniref:hypothetical protein n=1 Tax=Pelosinus sp. UFO1 TaxID=484770 RepID=UPI0004D1C5AD|nr:hypothetical protein [Pelosinus sp. UFO1]AIF53438.1 hypothetical protein UFO1_3895 [Pelosinus sp. UFO1]